MQGGQGLAGRSTRPQSVDDPVDGHHLAPADQQQRQHGTLLGPAEHQPLPTDGCLHRSQHAHTKHDESTYRTAV